MSWKACNTKETLSCVGLNVTPEGMRHWSSPRGKGHSGVAIEAVWKSFKPKGGLSYCVWSSSTNFISKYYSKLCHAVDGGSLVHFPWSHPAEVPFPSLQEHVLHRCNTLPAAAAEVRGKLHLWLMPQVFMDVHKTSLSVTTGIQSFVKLLEIAEIFCFWKQKQSKILILSSGPRNMLLRSYRRV